MSARILFLLKGLLSLRRRRTNESKFSNATNNNTTYKINKQKRTVVRGQIARLEDFLIAEGILHVFVQVFSAHGEI